MRHHMGQRWAISDEAILHYQLPSHLPTDNIFLSGPSWEKHHPDEPSPLSLHRTMSSVNGYCFKPSCFGWLVKHQKLHHLKSPTNLLTQRWWVLCPLPSLCIRLQVDHSTLLETLSIWLQEHHTLLELKWVVFAPAKATPSLCSSGSLHWQLFLNLINGFFIDEPLTHKKLSL